jgi:hypothetical protein
MRNTIRTIRGDGRNEKTQPKLGFFITGVADGARTHDNRNHNPAKWLFIGFDQSTKKQALYLKACMDLWLH